MRWTPGRAVIDEMLGVGDLERVLPSREHADLLIAKGRIRLETAAREAHLDPDSAYSALYDAARMALTAVLENQGLRPTSQGGHIAPYEAVKAQLDPPMGSVLRPFGQMRRRRHITEYPTFTGPDVTPDQVNTGIAQAEAIVDICERVLDEMSPY